MTIQLPITSLLVGILAVWRITHLLWAEDGPGDIFVRLRRFASEDFFGSLLDCFYCLSLWIALPFACVLGGTWIERGLLWFSLSGGAILLERVTARTLAAPPTPPAIWHEEPPTENQNEEDKDNVMLR
jgi:hypothetical protein